MKDKFVKLTEKKKNIKMQANLIANSKEIHEELQMYNQSGLG